MVRSVSLMSMFSVLFFYILPHNLSRAHKQKHSACVRIWNSMHTGQKWIAHCVWNEPNHFQHYSASAEWRQTRCKFVYRFYLRLFWYEMIEPTMILLVWPNYYSKWIQVTSVMQCDRETIGSVHTAWLYNEEKKSQPRKNYTCDGNKCNKHSENSNNSNNNKG